MSLQTPIFAEVIYMNAKGFERTCNKEARRGLIATSTPFADKL